MYPHKCRCVCVIKAVELNQPDAADDDKTNYERNLWIAYCAFHLADYKRALQVCVTDVD